VAELRSATTGRRLPWSRQRGAAKRPAGGEDGGTEVDPTGQTSVPPPLATGSGSLLSVTDLTISIPTENGLIEAVRGISLDIAAGETVGIVGESGSGKTMLALSVLGLLPRRAQVSGSIVLDGADLLQVTEAQWRQVRGNRVAMVFQDPMTALNPMYNIGWQVAECIRLHRRGTKEDAAKRAIELLDLVGLPEPARLARRFPHELSGGMRQRVVIAMAIANEPELLIADEPTTALDVTVQAQILDLLKSVQHETRAAMILITHDLGVVAGVADRVLVMYAGKAVEIGGVDEVFAEPRMPYTAGLLASLPSLEQRRERLAAIRGLPPSGIGYGPGCAFAPRCPLAASECATQPALIPVGPAHVAACHFADRTPELAALAESALAESALAASEQAEQPAAPVSAAPVSAAPVAAASESAGDGDHSDADPVLVVTDLVKHFHVRGASFRSVSTVQAVSGVSLDLRAGQCLALVGESGCGKSTLARLLLRLDEPTSGSIRLGGRELVGLSDDELRPMRRQIQMVFQDPYSSLNPRLSVAEIVGEPLLVHKIADRAERVRGLLESVGLDPASGVRFPGEFSGGQRQRIGIARALALEPQTIILDEPVSALDVSIQASVLNLLRDLQRTRHMAYLFIAHDLAVVRQVADDIAVMYLGLIVEQGPADEIYARPAHPYTRALMSAVPIPDPERERSRQRILLHGEVPSPANPPSGCRFRTRCWKADDRCATETPPLLPIDSVRRVACHYPETGAWLPDVAQPAQPAQPAPSAT
jgi:peptide/nickel transport system ATP-binding protein